MDDRAIMRSFEKGRGMWTALVILAGVVVVALVAVVAFGFRGKQVSRSAEALIKPLVNQPRPAAAPTHPEVK
jgi:flagellar basal body-associated protein FliL